MAFTIIGIFVAVHALVVATVCQTESPNREKSDAKRIVMSALIAHGGQDNAVRHERTYTRMKGQIGATSIVREAWTELPKHHKLCNRLKKGDERFTIIRVLNGEELWEKQQDDAAKTGDRDKLRQAQDVLYHRNVLQLYPMLSEKTFVLMYVGDMMVGKKNTQVVQVSSEGKRPVYLYFDQESHLLIKTKSQYVGGAHDGKSVEVFNDDFIEYDGLKVPTKISIWFDGVLTSQEVVEEYRTVREFPPGTFDKP